MNRMNRTRAWIVSLVAMLSCIVFPANADDAGLDEILKHFPADHLLKLQERDPDLRTFVAQNFPKDNASVVRADFNGDGNPDYALLLKNDRTGKTKLVVLLCSVDAQCRNVYELDETAYAGSVYLQSVSTGSNVSPSKAVDRKNQPLKLSLTGIQVNYFEKGTVVLRWNPKRQKIEEVQTAD
jgi:hypothetical protein